MLLGILQLHPKLTVIVRVFKMAYTGTVSEALDELNNQQFPSLSEGDIVWYPGGYKDAAKTQPDGHRFKYVSGAWTSFPA